MKLVKIITGTHYGIFRINNTCLSIIGQRKAEFLECVNESIVNKQIKIELSNLSCLIKINDASIPAYFAVNTSGEALFITEDMKTKKHKIGFELFPHSCASINNKLMYCNRNSLFEYNIATNETTIFNVSNLSSIFNAHGSLIAIKLENDSLLWQDYSIGFISLDNHSYLPISYARNITKAKLDKQGHYLLAVVADDAQHEKINFYKTSIMHLLCSRKFKEPDKAGYLSDFAYNSKTNLMAILWSGFLKVYNLETEDSLFESEIELGDSVEWLTDKVLIISTWNGVHKLEI